MQSPFTSHASARALAAGASILALLAPEHAFAQTSLPAVTVEAPKPRVRKIVRPPVVVARPSPAPVRLVPPPVRVQVQNKPARAKPVRVAARPVRAPVRVARPAPDPAPIAAPTPTVLSPGAAAGATGFTPPVLPAPPGQTVTTVGESTVRNTPVFTVADLLQYSPGLSLKAGNGPRDIGVSIRGSGARVGFGIRNIVLLEDGFPVTQPDGQGRGDLIDPHAYGAVDVFRGPSSALFGNYATGGAVNFRMRTGAQIDGAEIGSDFGSFGALNNYLIAGKAAGAFDLSLFASDARADNYIVHNEFNTQTINVTGRWTPTPSDRFTVKAIHNELYTNLPVRLSYEQFLLNPFQRGCTIALATNLGRCGQANLFGNGIAGARVAQSAEQGGFHRNDRRDIFGARWEHDFDAQTTGKVQVVYDDRDINQPTAATTSLGDYPSVNVLADITRRGEMFGLDATHFLQFTFNRLRFTGYTANVVPFSNGFGGAWTNKVDARQSNIGGRARTEIGFGYGLTGVLGLGGEITRIRAFSNNYTYTAAGLPSGITVIPVDQAYGNIAPESALRWRINPEWQVRGRIAVGYGTPQASQLFVTQQGTAGANTGLKTQSNIGVDLGVDWTPTPFTNVSVTGFYEWFRNEQLTQTPGAGLLAYTFNAPASVHRGIEVAADWRFFEGWKALLAYTLNDQHFERFSEQLGPSAFFDRRGLRIPGVALHEATARVGYDVPAGEFRGLGAFAEYVYKGRYFVDNGNQLRIPSFGLVNLNVHYDRAVDFGFIRSIAAYVEVKNAFDRRFVGSANNITNTLTNGVQNPGFTLAQFSTGSIFAGAPRAFTAGVKVKF